MAADVFGVATQAVGQASQELAQIRSDMASLADNRSGFEGVTGSNRVEDALSNFFSDSSDNREKMDKLLERSSGLLKSLAEGTASIDRAMAGALQVEGGQGR
ncbi:MAG TPA: hypothetical protein VII47_07075 [Actinomycetota bacterium]|jgi:hypothetical protein